MDLCMRIDNERLRKIESDLGLKLQFVKNQQITVRNCWHFTTDGNAVDAIFRDDEDFYLGMNRIYVLTQRFPNVIILAFCLMDTHIHFILYGEFDDCNRFIHEYVRRTSIHIARKYNENNKMANVPIRHQVIDNDRYLKNAICYTLKNPTSAGLIYTVYDYPWSSGPLLLHCHEYWSSQRHAHTDGLASDLNARTIREFFQTREKIDLNVRMTGRIVYPDEYVASDLVRRIFRTPKTLHTFLYNTREADIESLGGATSYLSIPMQEMRQHKIETCRELFGRNDIKSLSTDQRLRLAKTLKSRFNSSSKQILRLCGLSSKEVKL